MNGNERSSIMPKTTSKISVRVVQETEFLLRAPEVAVFLACRGMVEELRNLAYAFAAAEISKSTFMNRCKAVLTHLNQAADATERFDIVLPVMEYGRFSPFFWRWFNWWDDYIKELTPRQVGQIERLARDDKPSLKNYRPREHWMRYRHGPAFTLVIV
jgi:hypothetical protein